MGLTVNARTLLDKRYLQDGENEDEFWDRVSMGRKDYKEMLSSLKFLPNSPTLFNIGTGRGTLSACFKFDVPDSMDGILSVAHKAGLVQKYGGGVGYTLSTVRPKGEYIKSTHGKACGPVSIIKHYQSLAEMITQGGKREGAQMAILDINHPDIKEFIHMKDENPQAFSTFNISVAITDEFMKNVGKFGTTEDNLFNEICQSAWATGDPGMYFIDRAEIDNPTPWLGKLTGTNPCGEVPLLDNEPCNLGSINLAKFVNEHGWKMHELGATVELAIEYLDDVLDRNEFPHHKIEEAALTTRKLGLGVMGWADALAILGIQYDTEEAIQTAELIMQYIQETADKKSYELGLKKGRAPCFSYVEDMIPYRNATVTCIAPTGSISILAGCSSGIEPHYSLQWTRTLGDGTVLQESIGREFKITPKTAMEIDWEWHIKHQAAFQKYTDLAVSKTINLPNHATVKDIKDAYIMMWQLGCKGGTVFRDGCRSEQVLKSTTTNYSGGDEYAIVVSNGHNGNVGATPTASTNLRTKLPVERKSITRKIEIGDFEGYITIGLYENGSPGELFIQAHKEGSTISGLLDTIGILTSLLLQHGVNIGGIASKLVGSSFEPSGFTGDVEIPNVKSPVDYIFRWLNRKFGVPISYTNGNLCPDCGASVIFQEGCEKCTCGWSRC